MTVAFKIGPIFHLTHISDDFWPLNDWYADVFGAIEFTKTLRTSHSGSTLPTWSVELRDASLVTVTDVSFEPMSPSMFINGWDQMPVGRFYNKFGRHWHSIAWYVDDTLAMYRELKDRNIRFFFSGGGSDSAREPSPDEPLFTHPKDSCGALELMAGPRPPITDPRFKPGYDSGQWEREHPLGLRRLAYITIVVSDLGQGKRVYADALGGKLLLEQDSPLTLTQNAYVAVGDHTIVELAQPLESGTLAARELQQHGDIMHAVAFQVLDLDRAEQHLTAKGVRILDRDATTLLADPDTTFGAPYRFTTAAIPGDPRDA
jgi:catechol 2,3-dioxygenase-like lactoylglutathione lyase family enzyme